MLDDPNLYRDILSDHGHHPRGEGLLEPADLVGEGRDAERGDHVKINLRLSEGDIDAVGFTAQGSTVLKASCSLMGEVVTGLPTVTARLRAWRFIELLTNDDGDDWDDFGDAEALRGIRQFPARVRCAILPWRTLARLLDGDDQVKMGE